MINGLAHVCLNAIDLTDAERFYRDGLGLAKVFDFVRDDQVVGFYFEVAPGAYIEIFRRDTVDQAANSPLQHFCLAVDDIDALRDRLIQHGYSATEKKLGADQSWQMWTSDPSGVKIEFHQYTDQSAQITRRNCVLS